MPKVVNIEPTPNPDALKFVLREPILKSGVRSYRDFAAAVGDPLGSALFALGNVTSVFYMDRFVTVNKGAEGTWTDLIDPVCEVIESQQGEAQEAARPTPTPDEDALRHRIEEILETRVRPGLAGDGGGLEIVSLEGKVLQISYQGACGSCPSAQSGTLQFIEGLLQQEVDPELRVIAY